VTASGSATATCSDNAGNSASATQTGIRIDTAPPFISLISPINGFTYQQGTQAIANFSCLDALSGIATCTGTIPSGQPLPLDTPGTFSFTVTAVDLAGNQTQVTRSYTVVAK
jgi:Bacterial Ig-like domain